MNGGVRSSGISRIRQNSLFLGKIQGIFSKMPMFWEILV